MNTPNNARNVASKARIKGAFMKLLEMKPLESISVREICKVAAVNRTTFYAHFANLSDMMEAIEADLYFEVEDKVLPKAFDISLLVSRDTMLRLLGFIRENEALYRVYFLQMAQSKIINELSDSVCKVYEPIMRKNGAYSDTEYAYLFEFCKAGLIGIIKKWILSGHQEPEQNVAYLLEKLLMRCLP